MPSALERALAALVFYLIVTPLAVAGRAVGWDPLRLRRPPGGQSLWRRRAGRGA